MNTNIPAKSISDFAKSMKRGHIKGDYHAIIDKALLPDNSGSMILDFLSRKKIGTGSKYKKFQRKLSDIDMKAGGKAYDFLDKKNSKIANNIKRSLIQEHDISKNKNSNDFLKVKSVGILNPVNNIKKKALPFIGSVTVANHLFGKEDEGSNG